MQVIGLKYAQVYKYLGKDTDVKIVTEACKVQKSRCFSKCKYGDRYYSFLILPIDIPFKNRNV